MAGLSQEIEERVRQLIVERTLGPGERINEVHLARDLECSRTPLREALTRLAGEAFIEARPRLGFFVRPMTVGELEELYVIRTKLDPWALELGGLLSAETLDSLRALNERVVDATGNAHRVISLDDEWHLLLLSGCENQVLLGLIKQMMWRTRRYEFAYLSRSNHVEVAGAQHEAIMDALSVGDLSAACALLKDNMTAAIDPLIEYVSNLP